MKTLLLATICLACGVALGFVLNSLLFFGNVRWPGNFSEPTVVNNGVASSFNSPLLEDSSSSNQNQSNSLQSVVAQPVKLALLFLLDDALANGTSNSGENADLVFRLLPTSAYQHSDMVENWLQGAELDDTAKGQLRDMFTGVQSQLNSFPISGPYGGYPTVMPEGAMYQMHIMND